MRCTKYLWKLLFCFDSERLTYMDLASGHPDQRTIVRNYRESRIGRISAIVNFRQIIIFVHSSGHPALTDLWLCKATCFSIAKLNWWIITYVCMPTYKKCIALCTMAGVWIDRRLDDEKFYSPFEIKMTNLTSQKRTILKSLSGSELRIQETGLTLLSTSYCDLQLCYAQIQSLLIVKLQIELQ
jgi:hypothetical protein